MDCWDYPHQLALTHNYCNDYALSSPAAIAPLTIRMTEPECMWALLIF